MPKNSLLIYFLKLPSEPLSGFRDRFLQIYKELKSFYEQCVNLQYIRQLVRVPLMPDQPPDFQSTVPEFNLHHETLQHANELETRPPSPEPETVDSLIDVGSIFTADHGFGELDTDEFQIHAQLDQVIAERDGLHGQLADIRRQQTLEVTKLLEHIAQVETEKSRLQSAENERLLTSSADSDLELKLAQLVLEKGESSKKIVALDNAYNLLKGKHMKLVQTHANLLRANATVQGQIEKAKKENHRLESFRSSLFDYIIQSGNCER